MKGIVVLAIVATVLSVQGYVIKVPTVIPLDRTVATVIGRVHIQKLLLPLFEDVCEESAEPVVLRLSEEFQLNPKEGSFIDPTVIDNFISLKSSKGLLPKGEIFSEYNDDHMNELKVIYEVLVNAENFDTFYKAACWARQNVNCGIFVDAIYAAIMRRRDTERVLLPALYEVLPNYFVGKDYIIKASTLASGMDSSLSDVRIDGNSYIIDVNYTENYVDNSIEQMTYFNEDVDLNTYFFFNKLKMLKWFRYENTEVNSRWGQYVFQMMKQLNARYNLERYSIGLPEIDALDWDANDECIYDPMLIFLNGNDFNKRPSVTSQSSETILVLKNIENTVLATVKQMRATGSDKIEVLNYVMDTLVTGENSYENMAMKILSNINLQTGTTSVLGHYMTILRDPLYWRLNKKILNIVDDALKVITPYETNELYFPGVEVTSVDVKKPSTSCDNYEFDVTDALRNKDFDAKFQIKFNQQRLNNKPLSIKISISSLVMEKALIKIYIGPKLLPGQFTERKNLFMQLDSFETNLKVGTNAITRTLNDMNNLSEEFVSLGKIRKFVQDADFGIDALPLRTVDSQTGFPSRLLLPKGSSAPFQLFVFVAPFVKAIPGGARNYMQSNYDAILSPGYPIDLNIDIQNLFELPNSLVKDILITHKTSTTPPTSEMNGNTEYKKDYTEYKTGSYNLASPYPKSTDAVNKFDYKSKSKKYGKKSEDPKPKTINYDNMVANEINSKNIINTLVDNKPKEVDVKIHEIENDARLPEYDTENVFKMDKITNYNFLKDTQSDNIVKDNAIIKHIESKDSKNIKSEDEMGAKTAKGDYERVVTIDKNMNNDYSKGLMDGQVTKNSDNVVIKHIETKDANYGKNIDEDGTKSDKNDFKRVVTIDKNINNDYSKDIIHDGQVKARTDNVIIKHIESKGGKYDTIDDKVVDDEHEKVITIDKNIKNDYKIDDSITNGIFNNGVVGKNVEKNILNSSNQGKKSFFNLW